MHLELLELEENEHRAFVFVELVEDGVENLARLLLAQRLDRGGRVDRLRGLLGCDLTRAVPDLPMPRGDADADAVDPRPQRVATAKLAEAPVDDDEDLLEGVVDIGRVNPEPPQDAVRVGPLLPKDGRDVFGTGHGKRRRVRARGSYRGDGFRRHKGWCRPDASIINKSYRALSKARHPLRPGFRGILQSSTVATEGGFPRRPPWRPTIVLYDWLGGSCCLSERARRR